MILKKDYQSPKMQWHTPLMQNLKAREPIKEFVFFSLFVFYETIIGHSISVLFSGEISLFFDKETRENFAILFFLV
jgi:hypothetical protein